jgi:hypothetical protein
MELCLAIFQNIIRKLFVVLYIILRALLEEAGYISICTVTNQWASGIWV